MSPREVWEASQAAGPLSEFELVQKRCAIARVKAEDERKRAPTPVQQMELAA